VLHGKGLAVVVLAYNMYLECCKGKLNPEWKIEKPPDFWHFREKLSEQMLDYKPAHRIYPGDQNMRVSTQQSSKHCPGSHQTRPTRGPGCPAHILNPAVATPVGRVTKEYFVIQSRQCATNGNPPHLQLCGDFTHLQTHINSAGMAIKHPKVCHVCGEPAYSKCGLCDITLHYFSKSGANAGAECQQLLIKENKIGCFHQMRQSEAMQRTFVPE
jgi:hypothetical protein